MYVRSFSGAMRSFAPGKLRARLSSRVGACGRRPFESADPGVRRVGAFGAESNAGLGLGKVYMGRGLGSTGGHQVSTLVSRIGGIMIRKWRISLSGRVLPQTAHRTARGAPRSTSRELRKSFWGHSGDHFGRKSVRRRPSCPGSDVVGLKSDAHKFSDWKI